MFEFKFLDATTRLSVRKECLHSIGEAFSIAFMESAKWKAAINVYRWSANMQRWNFVGSVNYKPA